MWSDEEGGTKRCPPGGGGTDPVSGVSGAKASCGDVVLEGASEVECCAGAVVAGAGEDCWEIV